MEKTVYMRIRNVILITILCLPFVLSSCAPKRPAYDPNARRGSTADQGSLTHVVQYSGETLSIIAQWYTGRTENWRLIVDANPGLRPERIRLGDRILIPRRLVVEDAPLPEGFVRKFRGAAPAPKKDAKPEDKEIQQPAGDSSNTPAGRDDMSDDLFGTDKPATTDTAPVTPPTSAAPSSVGPTVVVPSSVAPSSAAPTPGADAGPKTPSKEDLEREKLLDELLSQ